MNLTRHFTLEELTHSDTAVRLGINNAPPAEVVEHLRVTAQGLEVCRDILQVPIIVSSGFRCEALERILCAKDYAAWCARRGLAENELTWAQYFEVKGHPRGWCADWTAPAFGNPKACIRALLNGRPPLKFDQLIEEGTWAHSGFAPAMRGQVLTAHFVDGRPTYTAGVT